MRAALQLHPRRISADVLNADVLPVLAQLGWEHDLLPVDESKPLNVHPETSIVISLGGDGTFLQGARIAQEHGLPILGVNVGRLGFLCGVTLSGLKQALCSVEDSSIIEEERCVLLGRVMSGETIKYEDVAVNDIVVHRKVTDSLRDMVARHAGELIAQYRADGIILASAIGSTAYNLAAGGPLVYPQLDLLILTPICAHSLFTKPLVLPPEDVVEISGHSGSYPMLASFDGRAAYQLEDGERLVASSQPDRLRVLRPADFDFFSVLRERFQHGYIYGADND